MTDEPQQDQCSSRRCVLLGAGVLGAAGLLSACSTDPVPYDATSADPPPSASAASGTASQPSSSASAAKKGGATGTVLGKAADIPVGGGKAFTDAKVVVTQPAKGQYKAFSAVCTHVGCVCNVVADGTINCPCHGSKFKITDGSVVTGPAPAPLAAMKVTVEGGNIMLT